MGKKTRNRRGEKSLPVNGGFDFGHLQRPIVTSSSYIEFNDALINAKVTGCAYGFDKVEGYPSLIPCLTLIGENAAALSRAFSYFEQWGCHEDGDTVDMTILLKKDGSYLLGVQPNLLRMIDRVLPDHSLVEPIYLGVMWIKRMDSTNPILREWRVSLKSRLYPIKIMAATASSVGGVPTIGSVRQIPEAPTFIKFGLQILTEDENPDHFLLSKAESKKRKRKGFPKPRAATPTSIASARRRLIDAVFPVSRERVRRRKIAEELREISEYREVSDSQIEQAVINVILSREWTGGKDHYAGIENIRQEWFSRVRGRVEYCGGEDNIDSVAIAPVIEQLRLDVAYTLREHGAVVSDQFATNQRQFERLGYGHA